MTPEEIREEVSRVPHQDEAGVVRIPRVHSWSDILAILSIGSVFIGGIVWGMKLEGRYDTLDGKIGAQRVEFTQALELVRRDVGNVQADVTEIKTMLQRGVLPVTDARLKALEERVAEVEHEHQRERANR